MNRRILFVDVVKIIAMICVFGLRIETDVLVLYSICSIAIPFLMSTGY